MNAYTNLRRIIASAILFPGLGVIPAAAQTPIPINHCQRITQSGTYTFNVTSPPGHTGYCIDVAAADVTLDTTASNGILQCNGHDNGIKFESTADNFILNIPTNGVQILNCVIGIRVLPINNFHGGIFVGCEGGLLISGASPGCRYGIRFDRMDFLEFISDTPTEASCPGGTSVSIAGFSLFQGRIDGD